QTVSSLLVLVLDTNPVWWGFRQASGDLQLCQCVDAALIFANSHLMLSHTNKLAIIAAHTDRSHFLYPVRTSEGSEVDGTGDAVPTSRDGKYELFSQVDEIVKQELRQLVMQNIHRLEKECTIGEKLSARILVLKGSEDNPSQYMNFMNTVFTAQKQSVVIDACILESDSGLLQQACDITGGIYLKVPQEAGLLQYLLWLFLPDPSVRGKLTLPPRTQVDYRAACFCHRTLIDVGYVCSVCLSIFCMFSPICSTCQTTFKILGPQKIAKKKTKKTS
ncbi:hypothetical protein BaRGS_00034311, partial [Batillaria attramentaria]